MPKSRITIVGLGLIGGSIGLALKKSSPDLQVIGHDRDPGVASRAQKRGAVDATKWNLIDACDGAGLIVLALPLDGIESTLAALKPYLAPGVIVSDTATTKAPVLEWAKDLPAGVHFIGGNPILKPDRAKPGSGIDAADANLFQGATYCLAPSSTAAAPAVETLSSFVALLGAKPYFIDAAEHDGLMAGVQHLPTLLATALAAVTMQSQGWRELSRLASTDFRSTTDLIPLEGKTAREQFLAHRADLLRWIDTLTDELHELRGMFEREDAAALEALIQTIGVERAKWLSGKYEDAALPVDWETAKLSPGRMLFGGLADVGKKRK
jgi:prephenate dehydrogenase